MLTVCGDSFEKIRRGKGEAGWDGMGHDNVKGGCVQILVWRLDGSSVIRWFSHDLVCISGTETKLGEGFALYNK